ncbi:hypothetical protein SLNWT_5969 [Streptomyces albus]|uniref:Uncharacterized protein n=1 Tax=Streptomyces albus (strain ATCC 21838 / DSM 41398 / FERM P-419 / JCM 4703 / NBRC 107858) TaxID=1081613 RepID=A0A0B5F448_STRA4|nr:hypothetical protein SLNWT_5969 [Streptomyces albus]AOU80648.1 hypothetical protein SLNHY_5957 [Streptomyces albus]AYN36357.1 hypothetical protein DUI70_5863 [Streptomyces albus]
MPAVLTRTGHCRAYRPCGPGPARESRVTADAGIRLLTRHPALWEPFTNGCGGAQSRGAQVGQSALSRVLVRARSREGDHCPFTSLPPPDTGHPGGGRGMGNV